MIRLRHHGSTGKTKRFLDMLSKQGHFRNLDRYGKEGVEALVAATPIDTGYTSQCWYYTIEYGRDAVKIQWNNRNVVKGVNIAVILQYGHGTGTGGWVEGRDYINPAIQPVFDRIVQDVWGEVEAG